MEKLIDKLFKFFEDKSISFSLRTSMFIIAVFILTTCDYYFNFSYDYHLNNKIEKLKSIDDLKKIYKTDSLKLSELIELENRIFKRTHYSERLRNLDLSQVLKKSNKTEVPIIKNDKITINKPIRKLFWMVLTSNYVYIGLIFLFIIFLFTDIAHGKMKIILSSIAIIIILTGIISFITWVVYQIPLIWNRPYLNYILNFILHSLLISLMLFRKKKRQQNI